jgi:general secretion pathway protein C
LWINHFYDNPPMQTHSNTLWWLRIATFLLAALAAASAAYWVLKWRANVSPSQPATVAFAAPAQIDPQALARFLGGGKVGTASTALASAASHFKLFGVIANRAKGGYALIGVDGKAAKPFRVGSPVNDALVLHSLSPRSAALAPSLDAPATLTLELPKLGR